MARIIDRLTTLEATVASHTASIASLVASVAAQAVTLASHLATLQSFGSRLDALEGGGGGGGPVNPQTILYSYDSTTDIDNPGRGLQISYETAPWGSIALGDFDGADVAAGLGETTPRRVICFGDGDVALTAGQLSDVEAELIAMEAAGKTIQLRFLYSEGLNDPEPPLSRILLHIDQLGPVIEPYAHVIDMLESGMIGAWGEGHNVQAAGATEAQEAFEGSTFPIRLQIWRRWAVAAPSIKWIAVRYAWQAMWMESQMTTPEKARLAFHCDQFLAAGIEDNSHGGTFRGAWYGSFIEEQKAWLETFSLTHAFRAETDWDAPGGYAAAHVDDDGFARYHVSAWRDIRNLRATFSSGKQAEILRQLGYRLILDEGRYPAVAVPATTFQFELDLHNDGYAPPRRPYVARMKFGAAASVAVTWASPYANPQTWPVGNTGPNDDGYFTLVGTCTVPALAAGSHALSLELQDPNAALVDDPNCMIRFVNQGTWNAGTGRNSLLCSVTVE